MNKNKNNKILGILLFSFAVSIASVQAGIAKHLTATVPVTEIVWFRYTGVFIITGLLALFRFKLSELKPSQIKRQVLRGSLMVIATFTFTTATAVMPLANATAVIFAYPFLIVIAAPIMLDEKVDRNNWIAVTVGFLGVLLVIRPGLEGFTWYSILALTAGLCWGIHLLVTRQLTANIDPLLLALSTAFIGMVIAGVLMPFVWEPLKLNDFFLLIGLAFVSSLAQITAIAACAQCETPILAPFGYFELISGITVGFFLFGDLPDTVTWLGMSTILICGIYIAILGGRKRVVVGRARPTA